MATVAAKKERPVSPEAPKRPASDGGAAFTARVRLCYR